MPQGHTVPWYSAAGGYMGMLIPYFISIAALPLGTAGRKFRYHEGLGSCDTHHRSCSGWWDINELGVCWGKNTDVVLSKQGRHQVVDRKRKKSILGAALAAFC